MARRPDGLCRTRLRPFGLMLIKPKHFPDIGPSFPNPRHFACFHAVHPGIIGSQREREFAVIEVQKATEMFGTASNVLNGIVNICHAQHGGSIRCQLHEPHRAFSRDHVLPKVRLGLDYGP